MCRRAFRKLYGFLAQNSACRAVSPLLLGKCKNALLFAALFTPIAVGSPVMTAQANLSDPLDRLLALSPALVATRTDTPEPRSRFEFPPPSFSSVPSIGEVSAHSFDTNLSGTEEKPGYEGYPYLLLTAGLILVAFRPAGPAIAGRY